MSKRPLPMTASLSRFVVAARHALDAGDPLHGASVGVPATFLVHGAYFALASPEWTHAALFELGITAETVREGVDEARDYIRANPIALEASA